MYFKSIKYSGRSMHSSEMLEVLGVVGGKLPREGLPARDVQGVQVWVAPFVPKIRKVWNGFQHVEKEVKSSTHRVRCKCPKCGAEMSAGRLFQHICGSK